MRKQDIQSPILLTDVTNKYLLIVIYRRICDSWYLLIDVCIRHDIYITWCSKFIVYVWENFHLTKHEKYSLACSFYTSYDILIRYDFLDLAFACVTTLTLGEETLQIVKKY